MRFLKSCFFTFLCGFTLLLCGAEKFQVTYLTGPSEPRMRQVHTLVNTADVFAKRLSQTLKQTIKVVPFDKADAETIFLITREGALGKEYSKILAGLPLDSFLIRYPVTIKGKKNVCLLMGRDAWGYCYPGNYFLRQYLGYDIVFPGEFGEVIPDNSKWQMPSKIAVKESPDFNTRAWTMNTVVDKDFARMNLAESRRNISWHTFGRVIDPKKYGKKHPEYFPLVRGKRHNAPKKQRCDWSPCVSNPDVQKLFVNYLIRNYGNHGSDAVELSVNDGSGNHCECAGCTAWDDPAEKAKGFYSKRYFTFYNKVLEAAQKINPDVKACILLYSDATTLVPKNLKLHPGLVGMSTKENTLRNFAKNGMKRLGFWQHQLDYLYPLPRHYPRAMAAKLREMHKIGVREYFGEVYMIAAANAPKQYILGRLLWDLNTDPDKVMVEYCNKAYGPQAGSYMKKYYDVWEKVYTRECIARQGKSKPRIMNYGPEWFVGLRHDDVKVLKNSLAAAEKSKMTAVERKRFEVIKNHFSYISCLVENYLDGVTLRNSKKLSVDEINKIFKRCEARDAEFASLWDKIVSKDKLGFYRRMSSKGKRSDTVFVLYRNAIKAYVLESVETALRNHQTSVCAKMNRSARLKYWQEAYKKFPTLMPVALMIGDNSDQKLQNYIQNGDFKKGTPGNPKVKGAHPKLDNWYFYEQIGDILADDYKNHWDLVRNAKGSNHLCFGEGKYPEIRQFIYLPAGVYRFSFRRTGESVFSFNMYEVPTFTKDAFKSVMTLRSHRIKSPAVFSCNHQPGAGVRSFSQLVLVEKSAWYVFMIATHSRVPNTWDHLMDVKLEKLIP